MLYCFMVMTQQSNNETMKIQSVMFSLKQIFFQYFFFFGIISNSTFSQDIHFSQLGNVPLFLNPASAGSMDGDYRLNFANRSQWASVTLPYATYLAGFDLKIPLKNKKQHNMGAGILGYSDKAGDGNFGISGIHLLLSYTRRFKDLKNSEISLGLMTGINQVGFDATKFYFDRQFTGDQYVPDSYSGETFNTTVKNGFDRSIAVKWKINTGKNTYIETGVSWYHLFLAPSGFYSLNPWKNPSRFSLYGVSVINLSKRTELLPGATIQFQSNHREILMGTDIRFKLFSSSLNFITGAWMRIGDAIIFDCGIEYKKINVKFSYDINFSDLSTVSNFQGGPEVTLIYIFKKPHLAMVPQTTCPVYY